MPFPLRPAFFALTILAVACTPVHTPDEVATTPAIGLELQRWLLPHQHEVIVPAANTPACDHLTEQGYQHTPAGVRVAYGDPVGLEVEKVFGVPW
ncbi:MAG: hypothetical protein H6595_06810 [Flavobacteriales bacterium]|nr:hypothetical protein [Flavobacteriales bacterium]MCB9167176.1 hypothetical protein [Flavobacteriales bacterium]